MDKENDKDALAEKLREDKAHIRRLLQAERRRSASLRAEAEEKNGDAEYLYSRYVVTHQELVVLRADLARALLPDGMAGLQGEVEHWRDKFRQQRERRPAWNALTRRAVERKAEATRRATDLAIAVQQLTARLEEAEETGNAAVANAQKVIDALQAQLDRIGEQCRLWHRGELDTMTTIAGITGEFRGHLLPEPGEWERAKAVKDAALRADLNEWKTHEAQARGFAMRLLDLFGKGGGPLAARVQAGQYDEVIKELSND